MEYNGFISTLIERSESLLLSQPDDDWNVTRLLLIMNTGFALVRDRIRYWDDTNDSRLRNPNPWKKVQKACKSKLDKTITVDKDSFFEEFRTCGDWVYLRLPKNKLLGSLSAHNIVQSLEGAEKRPISDLKLDAVVWALRNSFAHGGIIPMSSGQAGQRLHEPKLLKLRPTAGSNQIDRVYFVSKWTGDSIQDDRGWIVMEFGLEALQAFWDDWRSLILASGPRALSHLDRAA